MNGKLKRSKHNLSHYRLSTFDMGYLVPIACVEVLMGDTFIHSTTVMLRAATLVAPVMHPVDIKVHHWFVPNRIVWDEWDAFITGQEEVTVPTINVASAGDYSLLDHFGVPDDCGNISALPVRGYNAIWNQFYRDQDIIADIDLDSLAIQRVGWGKDYFTSCRPSPQQGTAISIPFETGTRAPVSGIGVGAGGDFVASGGAVFTTDASDDMAAGTPVDITTINVRGQAAGAAGTGNRPQIFAELDNVTGGGIDINDFRMAMAMQRHLEARNRWGSRIQDYLAYHGVRPRDSRLGLPEYLGGGKVTMAFSEVLATAEGTNTNVGDQAGHGIAAIRTRPYGRFFPEHGHVISLMSVRPRGMYADQLHRMWLRATKDDFWQKEYESFGPQAVLRKEVYGNHNVMTDVFGYNGRHDEYRRHPSYVTGGFRDTDDYWHMARFFESAPTLNQEFVECVPTDRIYADTSEPECRAMVSHNIRARRLVSKRARY